MAAQLAWSCFFWFIFNFLPQTSWNYKMAFVYPRTMGMFSIIPMFQQFDFKESFHEHFTITFYSSEWNKINNYYKSLRRKGLIKCYGHPWSASIISTAALYRERDGVNQPRGRGQVCPCCRLDTCNTCSVPVSQLGEGIKYKHAGKPLRAELNQMKMLTSFVISGARKLTSG